MMMMVVMMMMMILTIMMIMMMMMMNRIEIIIRPQAWLLEAIIVAMELYLEEAEATVVTVIN